jgi:hypothetical protein
LPSDDDLVCRGDFLGFRASGLIAHLHQQARRAGAGAGLSFLTASGVLSRLGQDPVEHLVAIELDQQIGQARPAPRAGA